MDCYARYYHTRKHICIRTYFWKAFWKALMQTKKNSQILRNANTFRKWLRKSVNKNLINSSESYCKKYFSSLKDHNGRKIVSIQTDADVVGDRAGWGALLGIVDGDCRDLHIWRWSPPWQTENEKAPIEGVTWIISQKIWYWNFMIYCNVIQLKWFLVFPITRSYPIATSRSVLAYLSFAGVVIDLSITNFTEYWELSNRFTFF